MTFLSSRDIGRGSVPPPAVVALITDAFLIFSVVEGAPQAWPGSPIGRTHPPNADLAADARRDAGAMPRGERKSDARELSIAQQKFEQYRIFLRKFLVNYKIFRKNMKVPSRKSSIQIGNISYKTVMASHACQALRPPNH
ncbi:MAG: hypothetical protein ING08_06530 [Roseomonas sp.]|nr:hypothetical protein [Roseomonas sp.]MCA3379882.1 hypothetical protein [Roseomonas sp.]